MTHLFEVVNKGINFFLTDFLNGLISFFGLILVNVMGTAETVLKHPLIDSGIEYAKALAFSILVIKTINEAFQTYILYQSGDPDSDPFGLLVRTGQAIAVIASSDWIIEQVFTFGGKLATDVAMLDTGTTTIRDWLNIAAVTVGTDGGVVVLFLIIIVICVLIVAIQATIRGAELALMSILGPIMALNLTANNRSLWSAWFKRLIIICTAQAIQIFMFKGVMSLLTMSSIEGHNLIIVFGWLWVTIKSPKYLQQFAYSTGFTGAVGGSVRQAGSMVLMRKVMAAK